MSVIGSGSVIGKVERHPADMVSSPVISELDIWRAASLLTRQHGAEAEREAARRAELMQDRGDGDGQVLWTRIGWATDALRTHRAKAGRADA